MRRQWRANLLGAWLAGAAASAQTVVTLDARGAAAAPLARQTAAAAGDVYGQFPAMEVVVFAATERGKPHRVGRVAMLPAGAREPFVVEPGPAPEWRLANVGRAAGTLAVTFVHEAGDWSAKLAVQVNEGSAWIDVLTTVENRSQRVLEFPAVDGIAGPRDAKLARDGATRATVIGAANGATLAAWADAGPSLLPSQNGPGAWFVGLPSADPLPGMIVRAGKRLAHFGKSDTFWPLAPEGEWDAEQRNRKNWHRVPAGGTRTLARRYVVAPAGAAMPAALQAALATPLLPVRLPAGPGRGATQALAAKPAYVPTPLAALPAAPPAAVVAKPVAAPPAAIVAKPVAPAPPVARPLLPLPPPPAAARLDAPPPPADPAALIVIPADDNPLALPPLPPPPAKR